MRDMKVLFAYDGSSCADAALQDLKYAGLPSEADCIVLTVADVWLPSEETQDDKFVVGSLDPLVQERILAMRQAAKTKVDEAAEIAQRGAGVIQSNFPDWRVSAEALADSPGWGILNRADSWLADLIVMGAHGMSAADRVLIGSVSRKVTSHASCSVRVARSHPARELALPRLIVGFDGSTDAERAVREVVSRAWPEGTEVRLITVVDDTLRTAVAARILKLEQWVKSGQKDDHHAWLSRMSESAAEQLRSAGLKTTCFVTEGEPRQVLLHAAQQWQVDSVFLGATGLRGLRRLLLGSVSSAVTASASCTVEVVRRRTL